LQTEEELEDSRTVQDIRTRHVKGGIMAKFVGFRIKFVMSTQRKHKLKTGRQPATKVCLEKV